jgi:PAS domain S-box-containing protein
MRELAPAHEEYWFEIYGKIALTGEPAHFLNEAKALNCYYEVRAYRVGEPELRQVAIVFNDISVRMHTEEALKRSMEQLQIFFEHAPASLAMFDLDMRYICASRRWFFDYGLGDRDLRGVSHYDIFPEIPERWKEAYRRALAGEVVQSEDDSFVRADGSLQRLRWEIHPWHEPSEGIGGIVVFTEDITERKRAEAHIRQLNRVYSVLSDINQTIVREKDSQAMLEAACRIAVEKGKLQMAWIGMVDPVTKLLEPVACSGVVEGFLDLGKISVQDPDHGSRPAVRCIASGKHAICNDIEQEIAFRPLREEALRRGYWSGGGFPLKVDGQTVGAFILYANEKGFFEGDNVSLLDEMAMDISFALEVNRREEDRRKAEEELRWRTAFFEAQVDSAQDGVLVVDGKGKKILQNQRLNELLKLPRDVFENPDFAERIQFLTGWVKNPDQFIEKVQFLLSHPEEISRDIVELLDGTILERSSSPVIDKAQNHYGRIWTFRDITERRQLEEQFRQSQKMEAVGQLTGGIAHDFNNLLTVILGCSEFIGEEAKGNPRLSKMAKMILDAAQRGADLTHRMLAFARRQALQPKPIDIHRMVANMESILRRTLSADIDLEVIQSREDCTALVDLTQLENALLNLCVNARDAMPEGGKLIVETGIATLDSSYAEQNAEVTPGQYILISVSDTGCGISPENLDRVFDPFFTTKEVGKGTGLGLSMVYGFVKQSQGHVKIYSEPGEGTSVKLYLPKADQESEPSNQEAILIADLHGSEVVLLVEDNAPVREFARTQLLYLGYQVLEAANGKDALPILREHPEIELLFTDVVMSGGLNGRELALEARKLHPALKVLFCSGYAESAILHLGLLDEHVQLLNKPYSRLQLAKRIRGMLTASPSAPVEEESNG